MPSVQELFGSSCRYRLSSSFRGPQLEGYEFLCAFENKVHSYHTPTMQKLGNIKQAWHGTNKAALKSIAVDGLLTPFQRRKRDRWTSIHGMFGPGIYLAPNIEKAAMFAWQHKHLKFVLQCYVALGKPHFATQTGNYYETAEMEDKHSVIGGRGSLTGAWGGRLLNEEWVIFDNQQATVDMVLVYRCVETPKATPFRGSIGRRFYNSSREPQGVVRYHPCKRNGKLCRNAFGSGGCVEKGITTGASAFSDYCRDYQVSLIHK